jgi:hypothetical protein
MTFILTLRAFFTVARREAIYAAAAVLVPLLVNLGVIAEGVGGQILAILGAALAFLVAVLQIANFSPSGLASWFVNTGRAAIYTLAGVVVPALVVFGVLPEHASTEALAQLSSVLTTLAALIGIYFASTKPDPAPEVAA